MKASGLCEAIDEWMEGEKPETWVAVCNVMRRNDPIPTERRFSVEDAKRAKLWGKAGPWSDYPKRMLQMRARAFALRDAFPDVLGGLYLTEEWIQDDKGTNEAEQSVFHNSEKANTRVNHAVNASYPGMDADRSIQAEEHRHEMEASINRSDDGNTHAVDIRQNTPSTRDDEPKRQGLLHADLPPIANLRRSRRMPRSALALRLRKQWSIRQPKSPSPPHSPSEDRFIPEGEWEGCLDLFDAALCCANDQESLLEIAEEFSERMKALPQHAKSKSDIIFERHAFRIEHGTSRPPDYEKTPAQSLNHPRSATETIGKGNVP